MKVTLITVGKIKEKYLKMAIEEYSKRLSRYCKLEIIEVTDEQTKEGAGEAFCEQVKQKEAVRILKYIKDDAFVITLEIMGQMLDSVTLAKKIESIGVSGYGQIVFVIGGSLGLHTSVSQRSNFKLSFSKLTFPHQLMRVILLEQIYRCYRINQNEPYHK